MMMVGAGPMILRRSLSLVVGMDATAANSAGLSELPENDFDAFPHDRHIPLEGADIASYDCDVLIYLGKSRIDQSEALVEHFSLRTEALLERHVEIIEKHVELFHFFLDGIDAIG